MYHSYHSLHSLHVKCKRFSLIEEVVSEGRAPLDPSVLTAPAAAPAAAPAGPEACPMQTWTIGSTLIHVYASQALQDPRRVG